MQNSSVLWLNCSDWDLQWRVIYPIIHTLIGSLETLLLFLSLTNLLLLSLRQFFRSFSKTVSTLPAPSIPVSSPYFPTEQPIHFWCTASKAIIGSASSSSVIIHFLLPPCAFFLLVSLVFSILGFFSYHDDNDDDTNEDGFFLTTEFCIWRPWTRPDHNTNIILPCNSL